MDILFNSWVYNLVAYLVTVVLFFQFYKHAVNEAKNDGAATILLQMIAGLSILFLTPFLPFTFPTDPKVYAFLLVACVFYAINDRLQTTARKHLEVSVFSILNQFMTVFLIVYGFTIFKEPIVWGKVLGAIAILLGNCVLLYKKGKFSFNRFTGLSLLASLALATAISIDIDISKHFNLPFYIMLTLLIPSLFIALTERITIQTILKEYHHLHFIYYLLTGICWSLSIFFSLRSFQLGEVSIIVPLQASAVLLNVLVATVFFKESSNVHKKIIAALLVMSGVYLTTLAL